MKKAYILLILTIPQILFFSCDTGKTEIARLQGEISQLNKTASTLQSKLDICQHDLEISERDNSNHSQKESNLLIEIEKVKSSNNTNMIELKTQFAQKEERYKEALKKIYNLLSSSQKEGLKNIVNDKGLVLQTHDYIGDWLFIVSGIFITLCILAFGAILFVKIIFGKETRNNKLSIYRLLAVLMGIFIYFVVRRLGMSIPQFLLYSYDYPALFFLNISVSTGIGYLFSWFLIRSLKKNHETAIRWGIVFSILLMIILTETLYNGFIEEINSEFLLPNATFIVGALINLVFSKKSILE